MKLNRTGSNWNRLERNKINENWDIIEGSYNDVVGQITDEVVGHLIDSAKLIWKEPVDTVEDLPDSAEVGETRMVREADPDGISYVYRYDGEKWEKIQAIDVTLVNEVDRRLTRQLAQSMVNGKDFGLTGDENFNATDTIQQFFDYAKSINAKKVVIPSGTHIIDSGGVKYNVPNSELICEGVFKFKDYGVELVGNVFRFDSENTIIKNFKIDGDITNNIQADSVEFGKQFNFASYYVDNIEFIGGWSKNALQSHCQLSSNITFKDFLFDTSGEHGLYLTAEQGRVGGDYIKLENCVIRNWARTYRGAGISGRDYFHIHGIDCDLITDGLGEQSFYISSSSERDTISNPNDKWHIYEGCFMKGADGERSVYSLSDVNVRIINCFVEGTLASYPESHNTHAIGTTFAPTNPNRTTINPADKFINCKFYGGRFRPQKKYEVIGCDIYYNENMREVFFDNNREHEFICIITDNNFYDFGNVDGGDANGIIRCNPNIRQVIKNNNFINCGTSRAITFVGDHTIVTDNHDVSMSGVRIQGTRGSDFVINNSLIDARG